MSGRPNKEALDHAIAAATQADLADTPLRGGELIALLNGLWPFTTRLNQLAFSVLKHRPSAALSFFVALKEGRCPHDEIWPRYMAWLIGGDVGNHQPYDPGQAVRGYLQARIIQLATDQTVSERFLQGGLGSYSTATRELAEKLVEITRGDKT